MLTLGVLAVSLAAMFALLAALGATTGERWGWPPRVSQRALVVATSMACVALAVLVRGLWHTDLTMSFVARHVTQATPLLGRLSSLGADPAGVALLTAVVLGAAGIWADWRGQWAAAPAYAVTMFVVLAAPLVGGSLTTLPTSPIDGVSAAAFFRNGLAPLVVLADVFALVVAVVALGAPQGRRAGLGLAAWLTLLRAVFGAAVLGLTGVRTAMEPHLIDPPVVASAVCLVAWYALPAGHADAPRCRVLALGSTLAALAALLTSLVPDGRTAPAWTLLVVAFGCVIRAAHFKDWWVGRQRGRAFALLAVAGAIVALVVGTFHRPLTVRMRPGESLPLAVGDSIGHGGVSQYRDHDATVVAVTLERHARGRSVITKAEQREYSDVRGDPVLPVVHPPAWFWGFPPVLGWLDDVENDDVVVLTVDRSGALVWWTVALGFATLQGVCALWLLATRRERPRAGA